MYCGISHVSNSHLHIIYATLHSYLDIYPWNQQLSGFVAKELWLFSFRYTRISVSIRKRSRKKIENPKQSNDEVWITGWYFHPIWSEVFSVALTLFAVKHVQHTKRLKCFMRRCYCYTWYIFHYIWYSPCTENFYISFLSYPTWMLDVGCWM